MEKKLQRIEHGKVLGGVATGLAEYLDMDVTIVRIIFILMAFFGFSGGIIYIVLWIALPEKMIFDYKSGSITLDPQTAPTGTYQSFAPLSPKRKPGNGRMIAGLVLITIGAYFLLKEFDFIPYWFRLHKLWPLTFLIFGLILLSKAGKKKNAPEVDYTVPDAEAGPEKKQSDTEANSNPTSL